MNEESRERFSDEQLKAVLSRAIELDVRGPTTSADELRSIASQVGISPAAVEVALREHAQSLASPDPSRTPARSRMVVVAAGVPLGIAAGALLGIATSPFALLGALGVVAVGLVASGALVVLQGRRTSLWSFQWRNLLLWSGLTAGGAMTLAVFGAGSLAGPAIIIGWGLRGWVASSILGSAAVVAVRQAVAATETGGGSAGRPPATPVGTRLIQAAKRVLGWISRPLRRVVTAPMSLGRGRPPSGGRQSLARGGAG